jgi:hypothetical protein
MNIRRSTWHARVYFLWNANGYFKTGHRVDTFGERKEYRENLCHYVRAVLIWAPCWWWVKGRRRWVGYGIVAAIVAAICSYLGTRSPDKALSALLQVSIGLGVGGVGGGALFGAGFLFMRHDAKARKRRMQEPKPQDSFWLNVVWNYLVARKRKVCPFIEFEDEA